jgi:hypothetical protein
LSWPRLCSCFDETGESYRQASKHKQGRKCMKEWQPGTGATCTAVLTGLLLFSSIAQAAGKVPSATGEPRGQVEVYDVMLTKGALPQPALDRLLAAVQGENREQAQLIREAAVQRLRQAVLVIELPRHEVSSSDAPQPALLSAAAE